MALKTSLLKNLTFATAYYHKQKRGELQLFLKCRMPYLYLNWSR